MGKDIQRNRDDNGTLRTVRPAILPVRTQFLIFTFFGQYLLGRGGNIWTTHLLTCLALLGVSERAVRSTLVRMARKGWLVSSRHGRRSQYKLTARGWQLLQSGQQRIFEPVFTDWNDQWHLVIYSLPEEERQARQVLRTQLSWLGYGGVAPGTWISPHDRREEVLALVDDLELDSYVSMFAGDYLGPVAANKLVKQCWDLTTLSDQYQEFLQRYQPECERLQAHLLDGTEVDPVICYVRRIWLTQEFQSFPLRDPNLPVTLLPPQWIGTRARALFDQYYRLLGQFADPFVAAVMNDEIALADCLPQANRLLEQQAT